jgi:hypothetical protein
MHHDKHPFPHAVVLKQVREYDGLTCTCRQRNELPCDARVVSAFARFKRFPLIRAKLGHVGMD